MIVNAPWIHQFHKINLDGDGKLRASMDHGGGGAGGGNFSASNSGSNAFSRMGTTQSMAGGNSSIAAALLSAPIETRITFNFGGTLLIRVRVDTICCSSEHHLMPLILSICLIDGE